MQTKIVYDFTKLSAEYNAVVILDGLSSLERQSYQDSEQVADFIRSQGVLVEIITCDDTQSYLSEINRLTDNARQDGQRYFLHYECHGTSRGIKFGNQSITWAKQFKALAELNQAMEGTLVLNLSTCFGIHVAKTTRLTGNPPFYGVIAPANKIPMKCAAKISKTFYDHFLRGAKINEAVRRANMNFSQEILYCLTSEGYTFWHSLGIPFRKPTNKRIVCP